MSDSTTELPAAELATQAPSIADLVAAAAGRGPKATALVVTSERIPMSYGALTQLVDDLVKQLIDAGLRPGDRVALRSGSNAKFVVGLRPPPARS